MKYIYLISILFQISVQAQTGPGPRATSMGSAGVTLQDVWSLQQNPAGIANIETAIFAIGYAQHFSGTEINSQTAIFAVPIKQNVLGLSFQRYGFSEYMEQRAGIAYAKRFGTSLFLAIGFNYHHIEIAKYGSAQAFTVEAGIQYRLTDNLSIASHIANPNRSRYAELPGSYMPVTLTFGISFRLTDKVLIISDVEKVLDAATDVKLGLEYKLIEWFSLRCGVSANPFKQYAGFGLSSKRLCIEGAVSLHPTLGLSPELGLSYEF